MFVTLENGTILTDRVPVAWIDTCVMLEVDSAGDIMPAKRQGIAADVEYRRLRTQGTLWLATAFALGNAVTLSYSHEFIRNLRKHTEDPELFKWTQCWRGPWKGASRH